jgi:hypothetical protein
MNPLILGSFLLGDCYGFNLIASYRYINVYNPLGLILVGQMCLEIYLFLVDFPR